MISHETTMIKIISGICLFTWWGLMGINMSGHDIMGTSWLHNDGQWLSMG
jgi:hypothetical protein